MMEAPPPAPFEMIEAELVFELLVIALDPPAQVRQTDEGGQWRRLGQGREVVLGRRGLAQRPLAEDPLDGAGLGAVAVMRGPDAQGDEARPHAPAGAFTPGHGRPGRDRQAPEERRQADGGLADGALAGAVAGGHGRRGDGAAARIVAASPGSTGEGIVR